VVEFFEDVSDRLAALAARKLGLRTLILKNAGEANLVWALRRAGLSLLTGRKGDAKPVTGIEDAAVRPEQLPDYVAGLHPFSRRWDWKYAIMATLPPGFYMCGRCSICTRLMI